MKKKGPKCRFCGARFSTDKRDRESCLERIERHVRKHHPRDYEILQRKLEEKFDPCF